MPSGEDAGRCHGALCFAARRGNVLSGVNARSQRRPEIYARRMVMFASELKVPSGRGHAAPASLVNLKKLEDRVKGKRGRGILASEEPPAVGMIQRGSPTSDDQTTH